MNPERRKLPRFQISPCQFHTTTPPVKNYPVSDLSIEGLSIRVMDREDLAQWSVGAEIEGLLKVDGTKFDARLKVKNLRGSLVGVAFQAPSEALKDRLVEILTPSRLAQSLKHYPIEEFPKVVWFHSPFGVDWLVYPEASGVITRWILFFHHSFLQWDASDSFKTGQARAEDDDGYTHGVIRLETRMLDFDPNLNLALIHTAIELIGHAAHLDLEIRNQIENCLKGAIKS